MPKNILRRACSRAVPLTGNTRTTVWMEVSWNNHIRYKIRSIRKKLPQLKLNILFFEQGNHNFLITE